MSAAIAKSSSTNKVEDDALKPPSAPQSLSQGLFSEGEKVLCFHGPLIYEAKVQKVQMVEAKLDRDGVPRGTRLPKYFIHYNGWNKKWDEWVTAIRMLKHNESNLERKRELVLAHEANVRAKRMASKRKLETASPTPPPPPPPPPAEPGQGGAAGDQKQDEKATQDVKNGRSSSPSPCATPSSSGAAPEKPSRSSSRKSSMPTSTTAKKNAKQIQVSAKEEKRTQETGPISDRPPDNTVETEEQFYTKVEVRINIPDELKPYLVDDWDYLTRQRKLVVLPARITVDQVIQDYIKYKTSYNKGRESKTNREAAVTEVTSGLYEYFNVMLSSQLLYKFEREQHADIVKTNPDLPMSKIYGPIHLLRLFVKLGGMLTYTPLDEKSVQLLLHYIHDILLYMKKNASTLFMIQDYGTAPPEYHRRAL